MTIRLAGFKIGRSKIDRAGRNLFQNISQAGIRGDVETAIKSNFTYLTIHRLAAENADIFDKYNRFAEFWTLNAYSLQTTFFVTFGRIFDTRRDVYSVHKVVEETIANPTFFSKSALRDRKRKASRIAGVDPEWLVDYVDNAWEPTRADLEPLRVALAPNFAKFKAIYQPIRHQVFAHKSIQDDKAILALFEKTLITDVQEILRFLHTLFWAIWEMAWNAKRPDLTDFRSYDGEVTRLTNKTEKFIRELP
jgi:AbiU2